MLRRTRSTPSRSRILKSRARSTPSSGIAALEGRVTVTDRSAIKYLDPMSPGEGSFVFWTKLRTKRSKGSGGSGSMRAWPCSQMRRSVTRNVLNRLKKGQRPTTHIARGAHGRLRRISMPRKRSGCDCEEGEREGEREGGEGERGG